MIRLLFTLVVLVAAGYGGLAFYYGATEPCDMLAEEITNQQGETVGRLMGGFNRMGTNQMSQRECVDELWRAWFDD